MAATPRELTERFDDPNRLIDRFDGRFSFLSNFHPSPMWLDDIDRIYPSAEHAFNALKTLDPAEREQVRNAPTPSKAKYVGRRVTLREHWDERVRFEAMREVIDAKFDLTVWANHLVATGDALLIEGTGDQTRAWHDQVWGQCNCDEHRRWPGQNWLGRLLMAKRAELRHEPDDTYLRVAITGHRPQFFERDQAAWACDELNRLAGKLAREHETITAISGMALGADTWWAEAALRHGLELWAYVPFLAQPDRWQTRDQRLWDDLFAAAQRTLVLGEEYDVRLLHSRNEFMIRDCDLLIAVMDPRKTTGGTASAYRKALAAGKTIVVVDIEQRRTYRQRPQARGPVVA